MGNLKLAMVALDTTFMQLPALMEVSYSSSLFCFNAGRIRLTSLSFFFFFFSMKKDHCLLLENHQSLKI